MSDSETMSPNNDAEQKLFGIAPYFIVNDIFQAAEFYRDKLGFDFNRIWGQPPQFAIVHRDGAYIMLKSVGSPGYVRPNNHVNPDACWDAYIWVKDADALYEELLSRGVKITRAIENTPYVAETSTSKTTRVISSALDKTWRHRNSPLIASAVSRL